MKIRKSTKLLLGFVATTLPIAAHASDKDEERLIQPFKACGNISNSEQRLQCFDAALADTTRVQTVIKQERRQRTVEDFGLAASQIERREASGNASSVAAGTASAATGAKQSSTKPENTIMKDGKFLGISVTISEVFTDARKRRVVLLSNGQMWRETSNKSYRGSVRPGWKVTIKKSGMGGYRLKFDDRNGYLGVRRIK